MLTKFIVVILSRTLCVSNHCIVYLNLHNAICQCHLSKSGKQRVRYEEEKIHFTDFREANFI